MRRIFGIAIAAALAACASDYQTFYQPLNSASPYIAPTTTTAPALRASTGDPKSDQEAMYVEGYVPIGVSSFNGPARDIRGALEQGKKVGATYVVVNQKYLGTVSGVIPLTLPTTQTSYVSGTTNVYGSGGYATGNYSGTVTTPGTETTYIPYSIARYDQEAIYFAPLKRTGLGILGRALNATEAQTLGSQRAMFVRAVRRGSPAGQADFLPGDIIRSIDGVMIDDPATFRDLIHHGEVNHIVFVRAGQTLTKDVSVPASW